MTIKSFMKDLICERLEQYEGQSVYGCDLGLLLMNKENNEGSYDNSTYKAKKWIKDNFDELGELTELMEDREYTLYNPFLEPDRFQVSVMVFCAEEYLAMTEFIDNNWNNSFILDEDTITVIQHQL